MVSRMLSRVARRGTQAQIRYIQPVPAGTAPAPVARVYAQVEADFGVLAPPISLHSPAPGPLAAAWLMLRESLVAAGRVRRAVKEAVAVSVSLANTCPYCVDVHSTALHGLTRSRDAMAVAMGRPGEARDPELRLAAGWAAAGTRVPPPFPDRQVPELVGTAATFHYLNRMSNVFLVESPIPPRVPVPARRVVQRAVGALLRPVLSRRAEPGASLDLLPAARLPEDLSWAAGNATVAAAFARAAAAMDAAADRTVPARVRALVTATLADRSAGPAGPGSGWVRDAVAGLPAGERPAGQLALLAALASYQVTPPVVAELRRHRLDDRSLVEIAAWASLAAARHAVAPA